MATQKEQSKIKNFFVNADEVVHKLIYPALLGSMIYGLIDGFTAKNDNCCRLVAENDNYWHLIFKSGIVLFYLLDYSHLYTFMERSFPKRKGNPICIFIDCFVALLLTLAFCQIVPYQSLCIMPFLFAIYVVVLIDKDNKYRFCIFAFHLLVGLIIFVISFCSRVEAKFNEVLLIGVMILYYFILSWVERKWGTNNDNEYIELTSNKGNTYQMNITDEMKSQDDK